MRLLGNDLVINEDDCNLSCVYCLTGQSNLKQSHHDRRIFQPPRRDRYAPGQKLAERVDTVIDRIATRFGAPLLKITGGEVFLVHDIEALIDKASARFATVLVQTNAALISPRQIERLAALPNLVLQISLDSHIFEGNSLRVPREDLHRKIVARIEALLDAGLAIEIYTVLTHRSIVHLESFAAWLAGRDGDIYFQPFPVRGPDSDRFAVRPDQLQLVDDFVAAAPRYRAILPPPPYLDRLARFYREGERRFGCHLPRLVVSSFSDGTLTPCPNIWFSDLGNLLGEAWEDTLARVGTSPLYRALVSPRPRLDACKGCFTPWDLLSMYMDDEITLDELGQSPAYAHHDIRTLLAEVKAEARADARARRAATPVPG